MLMWYFLCFPVSMASVSNCYATIVECVAARQPYFVWIFVHFSGSQHLLLFVIIFIFFLGVDLILLV